MSLNNDSTDNSKITNKAEYRKIFRKKRESLSSAEVQNAGKQILHSVLMLPEYKDSKCIAIYHSVKNEIDTLGIIKDALSSGKQVVLPKIKDHMMDFYAISSLQDLRPGPLSIPEPLSNVSAIIEMNQSPLLFLPGIVFNKSFHRIGFGGGYYDRYLETNQNKFKKIIALAYTFQVIEDQFPIEPYDICPDMILTPERIYTNEKK